MQVTVRESAPEASRVYQVLHGSGAGPPLARYPCNTATFALLMASFGGATGTPVDAGIHHDILQDSTTFIPSTQPWFSQRVRQRPDFAHHVTRVSRGTVSMVASVAGVGRQNHSTSVNSTTRPTSRHLASAPGGSLLSRRAAFAHDVVRAPSVEAAVVAAATAAVGAARAHHQQSTTIRQQATTNALASQPTSQQLIQSVSQSRIQPATLPDSQAANQPASQPASQPANRPASQPLRQSISNQSISNPVNRPCTCTVCGSHQHLEHACFIAHGVPAHVRMRADKVAEICRLHDLYARGAFDWRTTPTSLAWMLRLRAKHAEPASLEPNLDRSPADLGESGCDCEPGWACELCWDGSILDTVDASPARAVCEPGCDCELCWLPSGYGGLPWATRCEWHGFGGNTFWCGCRCDLYCPHLYVDPSHGPASLAQANACGCELCCPDNPHCEVCLPGCDCELCSHPNLDLSLGGDGGGSDGDEGYSSASDEGYSSALEDSSMQVDLQCGLPPGARIPPQRITPAVARARWRAARGGVRVPGSTRARKLAGARPGWRGRGSR